MSCRGCGNCRRTTATTTRSTPRASTRRAVLHADRPHGSAAKLRDNRLIPYLDDVLLDFPELVVVAGHIGFPCLDELTTLTIKFPNLHVDTSAYALHRLPPTFVAWMKSIGAPRVMFGKNWPMLSPQRGLAGLAGLGLTEAQSAAFLHDNARRVFGLLGVRRGKAFDDAQSHFA